MADKATQSPQGTPQSSAFDGFISALKRVGLHLTAMLGGVLAAIITPSDFMASMPAVFLSVYFGLICLFPRGRMEDPEWYMPTAAGGLQLVLTSVFGLPWQAGVFFAGLSVWLIRLVSRKGKLGWEWSALPALMIGLAVWYSHFGEPAFNGDALLLMPVLIILGAAGGHILAAAKRNKLRRGDFTNLLARLDLLSRDPQMQDELLSGIRALKDATDDYVKLKRATVIEGDAILENVAAVTVDVDAYAGKRGGQKVPAMFNFMQGGKVADVVGSSLSEKVEVVLARVRAGITEITRKAEQAVNDEFSKYSRICRRMLETGRALPDALQEHLRAIADSTEEILRQMRTDPRDRDPGRSFLERYLERIAETVADFAKVQADRKDMNELNRLTETTAAMLKRSAQAFADEAAYMRENDVTNLQANVSALDAFIKMHGH